MIGRVLGPTFLNMEYGTQHCPHKCLQRAVPLCQMQPTESNHLEDTCPLRRAKKGPLKQIVPQYATLKNHYDLLWEMGSNRGYINVVAVMQKFFDQAISGNWSYNPEHYPNNEIPVSIMAQDLLTTYKYGWKTSYYQNTYDIKTDEVEEPTESLDSLVSQLEQAEEEECESCKI